MSQRSAVRALADVTATLVEEYDVVSALTELTRACAEVLGAGASGILVVGAADGSPPGVGSAVLELLAASSHDAGEIETFQVQIGEGPCLDAVESDEVVSVASVDDMVRRWPTMGPALASNGFGSVLAVPLRWRGSAFGALNVFRGAARPFTSDEAAAARAFADVATLAIIHARPAETAGLVAHELQQALDGRIVVEQAKGVVAVQEGVDPGAAFDLLLERARAEGRSLAQVAERVVEEARRGAPWRPVRPARD